MLISVFIIPLQSGIGVASLPASNWFLPPRAVMHVSSREGSNSASIC